MKVKILSCLMSILFFGCNGQNSVITNEIIRTTTNKFGVKAESGEILIDTIFDGITNFYNLGRKTLPPTNKRYEEPVEFYLVRNESKQAIFDKDGKKVFDFVDCFQLEIDAHTKTIVRIVRQEDNQVRSYLHSFDGNQIFEESFENIGYINDSDLIALIVEDGQNDEFYLYNPFTKKKLGPYSHFNIYNKDSGPTFGMRKDDFERYTKLNVIAVRQNMGNKYIWGFVDMKGNTIIPVEYKYFRVIEEGVITRFIDKASKPEGVEFLFYAYLFNDSKKLILFDEKMNKYMCDHELNTIVKEK